MSDQPFVPPSHKSDAFNCPHCRAYAKQLWSDAHVNFGDGYYFTLPELTISRCDHCSVSAHWRDGVLVYPASRHAPRPNQDLSPAVLAAYEEAALIEQLSPRGAAALLRLVVQLLCVQLGEKGKNLNDDIKNLVAKGLPGELQQALDVVRVIGNNAVHPGEINVDDQPDTVAALFSLVNAIADRMITQPRKTAELFAALPASVRKNIEERDGKAGKP